MESTSPSVCTVASPSAMAMIELTQAHVRTRATLSFSLSSHDEGWRRAVAWSVHNPGPEFFHGVLRLTLRLPRSLSAPWFMVPGFFYGANRPAGHVGASKRYPRFDPACRQPADMTSAWWDFAADRTAFPMVFAHHGKCCFAVASLPHYITAGSVASDDPEPQVGVGFGQADAEAYVRFSLPACEEPFTYNNSPENGPTIRRLRLAPGGSVSGTLYIYQFDGCRHDYQKVLEHFNQVLSPLHPRADLPEILSLVQDATHGIVAGHHHAQGNYFIYSRPYDPLIEQIGNARGISMEWHQMMTGFVNGLPVCHGLLQAARLSGDEEARRVAIGVADRICRDGISPSGLFWADYVPSRIETPNISLPNPLAQNRSAWGSGWLPQPDLVHSRTIADACENLAGMVALEQQRDARSPSLKLWRQSLLGNLSAVLDLQLPGGSFGQYYDAVHRRVAKEDGCGGLLWIPAMIRAHELKLGDQEWQDRIAVAVRRAGQAYASYVREEHIWGGPEDNDSPTSEDGMNAVMAYCDLYHFTGDTAFLELAILAADWMLTFRKGYNQKMPPNSVLDRYGLRSRGGDYASSSNNHMHGFEVLCTRHLCDLSRWTGNPYYRERACDHWAYLCQLLCRTDGMFNGFRGAMAEQFYWCNWGSWNTWRTPAYHVQKGNMCPFTAVWCINVLLLAAAAAQQAFYSQALPTGDQR